MVDFCVYGFTMDGPSVGLPDFCDPFVYMKLSWFHVVWNGLIMERGLGLMGYVWVGVCI